MAIRYTPEELKRLRDSPLVAKPPGLPPAEQWMGPPTDTTRNSTKITDRAKSHDSNVLADQINRRPQHISRNSANPEDIILGPPKTSFMSATARGAKAFDSPDRPSMRDSENSRDRYNFPRGKAGEADNDKGRDGRSNLLRPKRGDDEADSDGYIKVKPRKSFGTEGTERFNGRMGVDNHRDRERFKDRDNRDRDVKDRDRDRPQRGFDTFQRDKDSEQDQDRDNRRNGMGRGGRGDSWRGGDDAPPTPRDRNSNGDRYGERSRGWREKERDDRNDRGDRGDRRWGRDQRPEVEPEWMDNPAEEKKSQAHTQEDFEKWRQSTKRSEEKVAGGKSTEDENKGDAGGSFFGLEKQKVDTPLALDTGPDKFFGQWATPKDEAGPDSGVESKKDGAAKGKTIGKASRFTSFFAAPQEEPPRRQTEPPPQVPLPATNGLAALFGGGASNSNTPNDEKVAFAQLLQKLQAQHISGSGSTPPANGQQQSKPPPPEKQQSNPLPAPEPFQQYRAERQDERPSPGSARNSQQTIQDLLNQRQVASSQPQIRTDQMVQELIGQRQNALSQSSVRDQPQGHNNTEFLMNLMRRAPEPQRTEQVLLRMPPQRASDRQAQQQMLEREQELHQAALRERAAQRQARPQAPPGFYDDQSFPRGPPPQHERHSGNPPQPTQILQRPLPPGLDQMQPSWAQQPSQLPPPQQQLRQQHIAPPPGLAGGPSRNMPLQQQMFPPGFPGIGNFPPPDMGAPPRMQPPPGFYNPPPPGFMPPGMSGFQGDGMPFPGFDQRGPPPGGAFRRQ